MTARPPTLPRAERIAARLHARFQPLSLEVIDESGQHHGHAGFDPGGSHFRVRMTCAEFTELSRPARHRLVYDALDSMLAGEIHALALELAAPGETPGPSRAATAPRS